MTKEFTNPIAKSVWEYGMITVSILVMVVGVYFFKFPNHIAFGGVTGFSTVVSEMTKWSASQFTLIANMALLVMGFVFLGRSFGIRTVYASILMSAAGSFNRASYHGTFAGAGICRVSSGSGVSHFV